MIQHLIIGVSSAIFFFLFYSLFFGKTNEKTLEEINKTLAEKGKPLINDAKGKLFVRLLASLGAGLGTGLISWIITLF